MALTRALIWDFIARDGASGPMLKIAGAADKAAASTERAQKRIGGASAVMATHGAKLTKGLTVPLLALGGVAIDQAVKYERSMTLIQTAGGESVRKMAVVSAGVKKIAVDTGTSLDQLGQGIYTVVKAGGQKWSAVDQIRILNAASQAAKAENVDLATSVSALTSVMMSYHTPASQAVAVQNEIIRGAGLAKTTMQEYAGALSTVVPIASSAHVAFSQVAGAVATLTQHGTSAQEATQELAFTLRNLQAPNNVAVAAMGQLGISALDVSKNLGKRGLTGTIDYIASKLPKSGLVYLDTMKHMASGTADLRTMIGTMPPGLAKLSRGFLDGSVSMKDYRAGFRDLGASGSQQGQQFLSLVGKVKGYNDAIRNGTPQQKTLAQQLKAIYGGAVGLNTALQLGGENMRYFAGATKDVQSAASGAGKDVLGWAKTQDTAANRAARLRSEIQVMAVDFGNDLLPLYKDLISGASGVVHWFDQLSGSQKKMVLWGAGIVAAVGPVLSITARLNAVGRGLGSFVTGTANLLGRLAGNAEGASTRITSAMTGVTSALTGAGIGVAIASLTRHSSAGVQAVGALASTLTGAAVGFGAGGPVGAAIGGLAGLIGNLGTRFLQSGTDAQSAAAMARKALAEQKADANSLLGVLQSVNGAYGDQYKAQLANTIRGKGGLDAASTAGISPKAVLDAIMGQRSAIAAIAQRALAINEGVPYDAKGRRLPQSSIFSGPNGPVSIDRRVAEVRQASPAERAALEKLQGVIGELSPAARKAEQQYEQLLSAQGKGVLSTNQLGTSYGKLKAALAGTGTTLDTASADGARNAAVLRDNIAAAQGAAAANLRHGKSAGAVVAAYAGQIASLEANATRLGLNSQAVATLVGRYGQLPRSVTTQLRKQGVTPGDIGTIVQAYRTIPASRVTRILLRDQASDALARIRAMLGAIQNRTVTVSVRQQLEKSAPGGVLYGHPVAQSAAGSASWTRDGYLPQGVSTVGESSNPHSWELAVTDSRGTKILSNRESKRVMGWGQVPGFAGGTSGGGDYVVNGIHYATARAAANARVRAGRSAQSADSSAVSGAISHIGQSWSNPVDLSNIGIGKVLSQIAAARAKLAEAVSHGLSAKSAADFRRQIAGMVHDANVALGTLRVKIRGADLAAIRAGLKSSVADTRSAFSALFGDLARAGAPSGLTGVLRTVEGRLTAMQTQLAAGTQRLADMQQYRSGVASTLSGQLDQTKYGSVADLDQAVRSATKSNRVYDRNVRRLEAFRPHDKNWQQYVAGLAASGDSATLQTLGSASGGQLARIAADEGAYQRSVAAGANDATRAKYGESPAHQAAENKRLREHIGELTDATAAVAGAIAHLGGITLDGKKMGDWTDGRIAAALEHLAHTSGAGRRHHK